MTRIRVAEALDIELDSQRWLCNRCETDLGSARDDYKKGCLLHDRDPRSLYPPGVAGDLLAPDPEWCRIVEIYCPGCGTMIDAEALPPGHPLTHDIEIDLDALAARHGAASD
jgi:acetophenone carboxylase